MAIIRSAHDLTTDDPPRVGAARSSYCYLFPDLANDPQAGLFAGTTPEASFAALSRIERNFRPTALAQRMQIGLAAVYTYFGQFVNHDLSAPVGGLQVNLGQVPPVGVIGTADLPGLNKGQQGRTQTIGPILHHVLNDHAQPMTLGSLYSDGPFSPDPAVRDLYQPDQMRFRLATCGTLTPEQLGAVTKLPFDQIHRNPGAFDIPRSEGVALIADRRNDNNLILSQLPLALMLLHNGAVDLLAPLFATPQACFTAVRALITHHYQWCILHDFLPKTLSKGVLEAALAAPSPLKAAHQVPMEFTTAAFRFGHSMVGANYDFNPNFGKPGGAGQPMADHATLMDLFDFTAHRGMRGQGPQLPDTWVADWNRLTRSREEGGSPAESIDIDFAPDMLNVVGHSADLAHGSIFLRNILRGFHRRIPFGQVLAGAYGVPPLTEAQVASALPPKTMDTEDLRLIAAEMGLLRQTPAWLYFLAEARVCEGGERLGPVASRIVADTLVGLLKHRDNHTSVLNVDGGPWTPQRSPLRDGAGAPLTSIRALLLAAVEGTPNQTV
jgi:hypothetical protein